MSPKEIYAALKEEYPEAKTDGQLTRLSGSKCIGKLKGGTGIGLKEAEHLVARNEKWRHLLDWAEDETYKRTKKQCSDMTHVWSERHKSFDLAALPPHLQTFCGYVS